MYVNIYARAKTLLDDRKYHWFISFYKTVFITYTFRDIETQYFIFN